MRVMVLSFIIMPLCFSLALQVSNDWVVELDEGSVELQDLFTPIII